MAGARVTLLFVLLLAAAGAVFLVERSGSEPAPGKAVAEGRRPAAGAPQPAAAVGREPASQPVREPKPEPAPAAPVDEERDAGEEQRREPDPERAELVLELLQPELGEERSILVRVLDAGGAPIPGALVAFRQGADLLYRERTDTNGEALFEPYETERGPFRIDAVAHGFLAATAPEVSSGATIDLILEARPWVEGRVTAPSLRGVVKLFTGERVLTEPIGADGTFRFPPVDEGYVTVQAELDPFGSASESFFLEAGTRRYVHLHVRDRGRGHLFGRIAFWPGRGKAWVNGQEVFVTPSGSFEFDRAILGLNEIEIDAPGKALFRERFTVEPLQTTKVRFRLQREAKIRGRVRSGGNGRTVAGAEVRLGVDFGDPRNDRVPLFPVDRVPVVRADEDGRFVIQRLDPRLVYLVSIVAPGHGQYLDTAVPSAGTLRIVLPAGPFLYGRLRGIGGVPVDAVVQAQRIEDHPEGRIFNVPGYDAASSGRDRDGFYGLSGLLPGIYLVRAEAPGYGAVETLLDLSDGRRERIDLRIVRGGDLDAEEAELLRRLPPVLDTDAEVGSPAETTLLHVDARRPLHEPPLPGIRVRFFDGDLEMAPPMDFSEPEFDITGLPEATYRAVLTHKSLKKPIVADAIRLRRGEPRTITLR